MKTFLLGTLTAAALAIATAPAASAGPIDSACMRSARPGTSRALCGCIQQVANKTLRWSDQRRAAKFFRDPDLAHAVRFSKKPSDDAFWKRYKQFGTMAEATCGG